MKFIDEVVITVNAGKGGDGSASFRREKYIPFGGPDGGDGGHGGSIFLKGDSNLNTLAQFSYTKRFQAENGVNGRPRQKYGKQGKDLFITVPLGSLVYDDETSEMIGEILENNQEVLVAKGGARGIGNIHFKSSTNRAPRQFTTGKLGDLRRLKIELKLIAEVGLIGLPNAGKSSLVDQVSNANLKIDSYPFTTLNPHLAKVEIKEKGSFIIADIPGIIEGASEGAGLGLKFLRHISRNKVLLHLIDIKPVDESEVFDNLVVILDELISYSKELCDKKQILVLNKLDLVDLKDAEKIRKSVFKKLQKHYKKTSEVIKNIDPEVFLISAEQNIGCEKLMEYIFDNYCNQNIEQEQKEIID